MNNKKNIYSRGNRYDRQEDTVSRWPKVNQKGVNVKYRRMCQKCNLGFAVKQI